MVGCAVATLGGRQITSVGGSSSLSAHCSSMQHGLIACGVVLCRGCRRHSWAPAAQPGWPYDRLSGYAMRPSVFCIASGASHATPGACRACAVNVLSCSRTPKPPTSALPGMRRSAATDAVGLAPSLLPRLGAVAITVTTTALDRVSGVVSGDACVPGFGCGLACVRVCRWVGLALRLVCEVLVLSCVCPGSPRCL